MLIVVSLLQLAGMGRQAADHRTALLAADRALAAAAVRGLRRALDAALTEDAVLLHDGAPVLRTRWVIAAALRQDAALDSVTVSWEPTPARVLVAADGTLGITAGELSVRRREGASSPRAGSYIAAWRRVGGEWRLAALMQNGVAPAGRTIYDADWGPKELPPLPAAGPAAAMIEADLAFAARAGEAGAAAAFREYAAPDAFTWAGAGSWNRGPEAIGAALERGRPADWTWYPVGAEAAGSGDLGFTVGQAVIRPRAADEPRHSKYLTVWLRQADGSLRFWTDGGNARPAP